MNHKKAREVIAISCISAQLIAAIMTLDSIYFALGFLSLFLFFLYLNLIEK